MEPHANDDHHDAADESILTAEQVLEREKDLEQTAGELLPYKTDLCSYSLGYLNQQVYACLTCTPPASANKPGTSWPAAGMCYACSIECHGDHEIAELFVKRAFRCDCGTDRLGAVKCCLDPQGEKCGVQNVDNSYNHNFQHRYCLCDMPYNPWTEQGVMVQCIACQDWFHDRCMPQPCPTGDEYHDLICAPCVESLGLAPLATVSVRPVNVFSADGHAALAALDNPSLSTKPSNNSTEQNGHILASTLVAPTDPSSAATNPTKRPRSPSPHADSSAGNVHKKTRTLICLSSAAPSALASAPAPWLYLPSNWRESMCKCEDCKMLAEDKPIPFLLSPEPIWTPEEDPDAGKPLFETGMAMLGQVDRVRALEGVQAMDTLSAMLKEYLRQFAEQGKVVTEKDIAAFFDRLKENRP